MKLTKETLQDIILEEVDKIVETSTLKTNPQKPRMSPDVTTDLKALLSGRFDELIAVNINNRAEVDQLLSAIIGLMKKAKPTDVVSALKSILAKASKASRTAE